MMQIATRRFVRPEFMNHHQTLYAGTISEWLTEAAMIGVTAVLGGTEHVVLAAIREIRVKKPVTVGMILELQYAAGEIGTTSVEIHIEGRDFLTHTLHFSGSAVFVSVDDDGRKKPHGLKRDHEE
ncbi:MAG: hypothetical protein HFG32_10795 [Eubacterium sp.]|jgi:acyl-CoA hydrolase|nr:hypothetical protein [Eubacterium sp.]